MKPRNFTYDRSRIARFALISPLLCATAAYGQTTSGTPPTSLDCKGFPQKTFVFINNTVQPATKVCLLLPVEFAAPTAAVDVSATVGNVTAHGTGPADLYPVYARIIAQAADEVSATNLAKSVVITLGQDGKIRAVPDQVDSPQALQTDFEVFTRPSTNLTLSSIQAGNVNADHYNATLKLTSQAGNTNLDTVQGQVNVNANAGNINVKLAGTAWTGSGLTATTQAGNILAVRPAGYQAAFTAQTNAGNVNIDTKTSDPQQAGGTVTDGSGAPIVLTSKAGNVSVITATGPTGSPPPPPVNNPPPVNPPVTPPTIPPVKPPTIPPVTPPTIPPVKPPTIPPVTPPTIPPVTPPTIPPVTSIPPITVPPITVPPISIPAINVPAITVPAIETPEGTIPAINIPAVNIPAVNIPAVNIPGFTIPPVPGNTTSGSGAQSLHLSQKRHS